MAKHSDNVAPSRNKVQDKLQGKWGVEIIRAGWTAVPNVLLEKQHALGLDPLDLNILLFVMKFWWEAGSQPFASKSLMAQAMRVTPRTIQRRITGLEKAGFIRRIVRRKESGAQAANGFDFAGIVEAARPFASEKIAVRRARQAEDEARRKRLKPHAPGLPTKPDGEGL